MRLTVGSATAVAAPVALCLALMAWLAGAGPHSGHGPAAAAAAAPSSAAAPASPRFVAQRLSPDLIPVPKPVAAKPADPDPTVLFLHGILSGGGCVGQNTGQVFSYSMKMLHAAHWTGAMIPLDFYCGDVGGTSIQNQCPGNYQRPPNDEYDDDASIERIACDLAWYVYRNDTARGKAVDLVGYSMGGLIMRYALYAVATHQAHFPKGLLVRDAVTIDAPNDGVSANYSAPGRCGHHAECLEMTTGAAILQRLQVKARDPQPSRLHRTDWTAMGAGACDIMPAGDTTDMGLVHKVAYTATSGRTCYTHVSALSDTSTARDAPVRYGTGTLALHTSRLGLHALAWMVRALQSPRW